MGAEAEQIGHGLDGADGVEHHGSLGWVIHARVDVAQRERDSFERNKRLERQPSRGDLVAQLLWRVGVPGEASLMCRRERTGTLYLVDQIEERRVLVMESRHQDSVETGGPSGYRGDVHDPTGSDDAARFAQRLDSIADGNQVIERPQ